MPVATASGRRATKAIKRRFLSSRTALTRQRPKLNKLAAQQATAERKLATIKTRTAASKRKLASVRAKSGKRAATEAGSFVDAASKAFEKAIEERLKRGEKSSGALVRDLVKSEWLAKRIEKLVAMGYNPRYLGMEIDARINEMREASWNLKRRRDLRVSDLQYRKIRIKNELVRYGHKDKLLPAERVKELQRQLIGLDKQIHEISSSISEGEIVVEGKIQAFEALKAELMSMV